VLVLTRRLGETIVIAGEIRVTVLEVRGDVVRLGIDAPKHVKVHRAEILIQVSQENQAAVLTDASAALRILGRGSASDDDRQPT
jgi:carbon storage regulator